MIRKIIALFRKKTVHSNELTLTDQIISVAELLKDPASNIDGLKLNSKVLDYSIDSLSEIEQGVQNYCDAYGYGAENETFQKVVFRIGAYVGEVIRRNNNEFNWIAFEDLNKDQKVFFGTEKEIHNVFVLCDVINDQMTSPLNKIAKRLINGPEDDLTFYVKVILENSNIKNGNENARN